MYYGLAMGKKNHDFGLINYKDVPRKNQKKFDWLAGSTDGIVTDNHDKEGLIVLEVKCPYYRKVKYGMCPEYYYPQVQLNMAILNIDKADFIEYKPVSKYQKFQLNIVRIQRDYEWFNENVPKLEKFWNEVLYWREKGIRSHPQYNKYHKKILNL